MTFAEMKTEVFRRLNESRLGASGAVTPTPIFWQEDDVVAALIDGYQELSDAAEWYEREYDIPLSGQTYYNMETVLSDIFLSPRRAFNPRTNRWMEWVDVRDLDYRTYRRWELITGEPQQILFRGIGWLGTFPKKSGDTLQFFYTSIPPDLEDADTPLMPQEFHLGIIDYALYDLMCQEAETAKALKFWQSYLNYEEGLKRYVKNRVSLDRIGGYRSN